MHGVLAHAQASFRWHQLGLVALSHLGGGAKEDQFRRGWGVALTIDSRCSLILSTAMLLYSSRSVRMVDMSSGRAGGYDQAWVCCRSMTRGGGSFSERGCPFAGCHCSTRTTIKRLDHSHSNKSDSVDSLNSSRCCKSRMLWTVVKQVITTLPHRGISVLFQLALLVIIPIRIPMTKPVEHREGRQKIIPLRHLSNCTPGNFHGR